MFAPVRVSLGFTLFALLLICFKRSSLAATLMPHAAAIDDMCDHSLACSVLDEKWPKNQAFQCGTTHVSPTAVQTATQALKMGQPRKLGNGTKWPSSAAQNCGGLQSGYSKHAYSNGLWTIYYKIQSICKCKAETGDPRSIPTCQSDNPQDPAACNLAIFKFCCMEMNGSPCVAQ